VRLRGVRRDGRNFFQFLGYSTDPNLVVDVLTSQSPAALAVTLEVTVCAAVEATKFVSKSVVVTDFFPRP
jgi:hypothetical protein